MESGLGQSHLGYTLGASPGLPLEVPFQPMSNEKHRFLAGATLQGVITLIKPRKPSTEAVLWRVCGRSGTETILRRVCGLRFGILTKGRGDSNQRTKGCAFSQCVRNCTTWLAVPQGEINNLWLLYHVEMELGDQVPDKKVWVGHGSTCSHAVSHVILEANHRVGGIADVPVYTYIPHWGAPKR